VALLPQELLEYISSFILPSPAQKLFVAFGDTLNILMELETNPAYKITFSYQDTIFMSQIQFGGTTYITRLHNDQTQNSTLLFKSGVARPNFAVIWLNMIGITHVEFLSSMDRITPRQVDREWVYAISISDSIHVQRKVIYFIFSSSINLISNRARSLHELITLQQISVTSSGTPGKHHFFARSSFQRPLRETRCFSITYL
jgi:hypothetical protein